MTLRICPLALSPSTILQRASIELDRKPGVSWSGVMGGCRGYALQDLASGLKGETEVYIVLANALYKQQWGVRG